MTKAGNKKRKSKNVFLTISVVTFLASSLLYFGSCIFFKTYENHLTAQKQTLEAQILSIEQENNEVVSAINELATSKRITGMAETTLKYQGNNIVTITNDDQ